MPDVDLETRMVELAEVLFDSDQWDSLSWDDAWRGVYPDLLLPDERAKRIDLQVERLHRILNSDVTELTGLDCTIYFDLKYPT